MKLDIETLDDGLCLVRSHDAQSLVEIPDEQLKSIMRSSGAVLFRGFNVGSVEMKTFADRFSSRFNRDRLRIPVEGTNGQVQLVTEGMGYVEPHSEQANSPFRPDAIWFCCRAPAAEDGETLVWDGVRIWESFCDDLRELFSSKRLRFFQRYNRQQWRLFLGQDSTIDDVHRTLNGHEGVSLYVAPDESVYFEYLCPAVVRTRFRDELAFANGLLTEQHNTLGTLMTFEDGTPVNEEIIRAVEENIAPFTIPIRWEPGDLAFIDNSRFMHGRNAFTDTRRCIFSCMSFLNF